MHWAFELLEKYPRWVALIAGGVSAMGFAPLGLWPLTLICLGVLMHLVAKAAFGKRAYWIGWLFGLAHFGVGLNWLAKSFTFQSNMPAILGWLAVLLVAAVVAHFPALAAWGAWWTGRRVDPAKATAAITLPFILAFAGCWIIAEWLRSWVFTGFPWNPLATVTANFGWFVKPAAYLGTYGQSGLVVLTVGLAIMFGRHVLHELQRKPLTPGRIAFVIAFFVLPELIIFAVLPFVMEPSEPKTSKVNITVVQPNIGQEERNRLDYSAFSFDRLAKYSTPKDDTPRLVFWPESAIPWMLESGYPYRYYQSQPGESAQSARLVLAGLLNPKDLLITGNDRLEFDKHGQLVGARNSLAVLDARGERLGHYDKAHLVPFGEYLALRWLLEPLGAARLVPGSIDFWPGPGPRTMQLGEGFPKIGVQICYEIIFSGRVTDRANRPAFLFNPSNDAWFGDWGPPQHLAQTRLRAIEEGLPIVRSTPTGISAVIDADGRIVESIPLHTAGRIDTTLPRAHAPTLFARHGNVLPLGFAALLIALSLSSALIPLARRHASR